MEKRRKALKEADKIRKRMKVETRPVWMDIREDRDAEDDPYH